MDAAALIEAGLVPDDRQPVKILGDGEVTKKLTVVAGWYSRSAHQKITAAGGTPQNLKNEPFEFPKPKKKFVKRDPVKKKAPTKPSRRPPRPRPRRPPLPPRPPAADRRRKPRSRQRSSLKTFRDVGCRGAGPARGQAASRIPPRRDREHAVLVIRAHRDFTYEHPSPHQSAGRCGHGRPAGTLHGR